MIPFKIELISVEYYQLKSITTALSGSMMIVDTSAKHGLRRVDIPLAVARSFIIEHDKISRYLNPVWIAVGKYDGHVFAIERHPFPLSDKLELDLPSGTKQWESNIERNLYDHIIPYVIQHDENWYFDGRYIYSVGHDINQAIKEGTFLTEDGSLRQLEAHTIDLKRICYNFSRFDSKTITVIDSLSSLRTCVSYMASTGDFAITPPIWLSAENIGSSLLRGDEDDEAAGQSLQKSSFVFDMIDNTMLVNLNFSLTAGISIGKMYGYTKVDPLQLARLMIELRTVNLPTLPKNIKQTHNSGLLFTHAFVWLMGLDDNNSYDKMIAIRSLLSYLTRKSLVERQMLLNTNIFMEGKTSADVLNIPFDANLTKQIVDQTAQEIIDAKNHAIDISVMDKA